MRGSWKGLFYLKEGKKCNCNLSKKHTELTRDTIKPLISLLIHWNKKRYESQWSQSGLTLYFSKRPKIRKFLRFPHKFFRLPDQSWQGKSFFPTINYT